MGRVVWLFLGLAFGISWGAHGLRTFFEWSDPVREALNLTVKFGPSLAGVITAGVTAGPKALGDMARAMVRGPAVWLMLAVLLPLAVAQVALGIRFFVGGPVGAPALTLGGAVSVFGTLLATRFFLGGGLGEELGWRGVMLPELQKRMDPLRASLWIGVAWALWHLPAYGAALVVFAPFAIALSVVFTFFYNKTGGSLLVVALLHASINASAPTVEAVFPGLDGEILIQLLVLLGWGALALALVWRVGAGGLDPGAAPEVP